MVVEPDPADETNFLLSFVTSTRRKFIKSVKALVGAPKISLDGSKICYCKTDGNGIEILKLNVENAAEEDVVIASNFDKCEFSIKPSGDGIVVAKGTQIISIDFGAKQERPILSGIVDVSLPIYSHDSTKLFYISGDSIFVKEIDEMMPKIVLKLEKNYDAEYLEISRNNKHFLVKYKRNKAAMLYYKDGEKEFFCGSITDETVQILDAFFSPDGKYFYARILNTAANDLIFQKLEIKDVDVELNEDSIIDIKLSPEVDVSLLKSISIK